MSILVLNAGSSTLKFSLFDQSAREELANGLVDWRGRDESATLQFRSLTTGEKQSTLEVADYGEAASRIIGSLRDTGFDDPIDVVGHRMVHGGTEFSRTTLINDHVSQSLQRISELAALHNPSALTTIDPVQLQRSFVPHDEPTESVICKRRLMTRPHYLASIRRSLL